MINKTLMVAPALLVAYSLMFYFLLDDLFFSIAWGVGATGVFLIFMSTLNLVVKHD